jgi:lipopolysaccharide export system protein LptA
MIKFVLLAVMTAGALTAPAWAQAPAKAPAAAAGKDRSSAFGNLGSNKEPIKIDADKLDVFDKESRAVFEGNVVAVQGDSTMKCTALTVFYEPRNQAGDTKNAAAATPGSSDNSIRKIDCKGPVTIVSKTQVATGDNATFDRIANKVFLIGNAALSDGPNVTRGERIVYDLNTSVANVETAPGGRVRALFVPGTNAEGAGDKAGDKAKAQRPATN